MKQTGIQSGAAIGPMKLGLIISVGLEAAYMTTVSG